MPRPLCVRHAGRGESTDRPYRWTSLAGSLGKEVVREPSLTVLQAPAPEAGQVHPFAEGRGDTPDPHQEIGQV